jgi:hypothetical protein
MDVHLPNMLHPNWEYERVWPVLNSQSQKCQTKKKTESFPAYEIASARGSMIFKSFCSEDAASTDLLHRSRPRLRVQPSIVAKFEQNQKGNNTLQPCKELKKVFFQEQLSTDIILSVPSMIKAVGTLQDSQNRTYSPLSKRSSLTAVQGYNGQLPCSQLPDGVFGIFKPPAPRCTGQWQLCHSEAGTLQHLQSGYCKDKPKNRAFFSPVITMAAASSKPFQSHFQLVGQLILYPRSRMTVLREMLTCVETWFVSINRLVIAVEVSQSIEGPKGTQVMLYMCVCKSNGWTMPSLSCSTCVERGKNAADAASIWIQWIGENYWKPWLIPWGKLP